MPIAERLGAATLIENNPGWIVRLHDRLLALCKLTESKRDRDLIMDTVARIVENGLVGFSNRRVAGHVVLHCEAPFPPARNNLC
jgi:hypothetical protein